ncbi:MAG: hypothetical protein ACFFFB_07460 [Candidatus Heimdallarchaeota archaeon]
MDKLIREFAPELSDLYNIREDESEEQQVKTGRLHENRILGIILKFYLDGKKKVTTREVELEYRKYFKEIARSTISTYLNMLKKESTLCKERDGRLVYYKFYEDPPININPFWFTRLFCVDPVYFFRAIYFSSIYSIAEKVVQEYMSNGNFKEVLVNLKYLIGLIILFILRNKVNKCVLCQFGKQEKYDDLNEALAIALKERTDVLPDELLIILEEKYSEIPLFGGINFSVDDQEINMIKQLVGFANRYKKDLEFQYMVLNRRIDARSVERTHIESELDSKEEKQLIN